MFYFLLIILLNNRRGDIFLPTLKLKLCLCNKLRVAHLDIDKDGFEIKEFFSTTISWFIKTVTCKINITLFNSLLPPLSASHPFPPTLRNVIYISLLLFSCLPQYLLTILLAGGITLYLFF